MNSARTPLNWFIRFGLCLALAWATMGAQRVAPAFTTFLVVDRNDDAGGLACTDGDPSDCTLRSAIQLANTDAVDDIISFSTSMTITYLSQGVPLTATGTTIFGAPAQRISIDANFTGNVFRIRANNVTIDGLRVFGSGAGTSNIWISDAAQRVRIANNVIGDDDLGLLGDCGNSTTSYSGIFVSSTANPAGSDALAWIYGNEIKCNGGLPGYGVIVSAAQEVVFGADALGNAGPAQRNYIELNAGHGVALLNSNANIIRNSFLQYNAGSGLVIDDGNSNAAYGDYFQANQKSGVVITNSAQLNQIGCPLGTLDPAAPGLLNHIKQNHDQGVLISGAGTNSNLVLCNWIGADDGSLPAAGNLQDGVRIENGARSNIIGNDDGTRNVISANTRFGVEITGAGTNNNLVRSNYVGTNITATAALPNLQGGMNLANGASFNTIGGTLGVHRNLIGGNHGSGILIQGNTTATNTVTSNQIGIDASGGNLPLPNTLLGIGLVDHTHGNIIGGASGPNHVAYNQADGILLTNGANFNQILSNVIYSNTGNGVELDGAGTAFNVISQTLVAYNTFDGISEGGGATLNIWQHITSYANHGLGIDKFVTNALLNVPDAPFPMITAINAATGQITGTASSNALVEVYRAYPNWSGYGEGKIYEATVFSDGSGNWTASVAPGNACYTAFQTVGFIIYSSSEFGPNTCRVFAPVVVR